LHFGSVIDTIMLGDPVWSLKDLPSLSRF
jgi:hypothetical protein